MRPLTSSESLWMVGGADQVLIIFEVKVNQSLMEVLLKTSYSIRPWFLPPKTKLVRPSFSLFLEQ
jgi:hypothetical protein